MLSKMSKTDKTIFRYLGLALLILIVLGTLFGVSSVVVKESYNQSHLFAGTCGEKLKKHRGCQVKKFCFDEKKMYNTEKKCRNKWWGPNPRNDLRGSTIKGGGYCGKTFKKLYKCQLDECMANNPNKTKKWCKSYLLNRDGTNPDYLRKIF